MIEDIEYYEFEKAKIKFSKPVSWMFALTQIIWAVEFQNINWILNVILLIPSLVLTIPAVVLDILILILIYIIGYPFVYLLKGVRWLIMEFLKRVIMPVFKWILIIGLAIGLTASYFTGLLGITYDYCVQIINIYL